MEQIKGIDSNGNYIYDNEETTEEKKYLRKVAPEPPENIMDNVIEAYPAVDSDGMMPDDDKVNPSHYQSLEKDLENIDCITAMRAAFGDEVVSHFCLGNSLKYLWRHESKGGKTDLEKCKWYIDKYIELNYK